MKKFTVYVTISIVAIVIVAAALMHNRAKLASGAGGVTLSEFPVTITTLQQIPTREALTYTGTIAANNDVAVVSETAGRVVAMRAKVGDLKRAGDVLVEVDSELAAAACTAAEVAYEKAQRDLERNERLLKATSISESQFEAVRLNCKAAEAQFVARRRALANTKITTPISGTVSSLAVDTGNMIQDKQVVANVIDVATLKVKVGVPEEDVFKLAVGDSVEVSTDVYPGIAYTGTIHTISFKADEAHTYQVEITVPNRHDSPLRANMFGKVTFQPKAAHARYVLPRATLVGSVEQPQVYIVNGNTARLRNIEVGEAIGLNVEVRSGLIPTDTVVLNGQYNLRDNTPVKVISQGDKS